MYKYARTRNRVHRVHVEGGRAFKVEQCNLDDATYFGLDDEPEPGVQHCAYCWVIPELEKQVEKEAETTPALTKKELPRSVVVLPRRLAVLGLLLVAMFALLTGNASGVVLSPDLPSPTPTDDHLTSDDIVQLIERIVDEKILIYHIHDHGPGLEGASPSPTATASSTAASPTATPTPTNRPASPSSAPTSRPTTAPSNTSTARPRATSRPTRVPATPSPTPTPCFRPGHPQSGIDPCKWPPDN